MDCIRVADPLLIRHQIFSASTHCQVLTKTRPLFFSTVFSDKHIKVSPQNRHLRTGFDIEFQKVQIAERKKCLICFEFEATAFLDGDVSVKLVGNGKILKKLDFHIPKVFNQENLFRFGCPIKVIFIPDQKVKMHIGFELKSHHERFSVTVNSATFTVSKVEDTFRFPKECFQSN